MNFIKIFCGLLLATLIVSCSNFLEERSDSSLAVPSTLEDNQALLDKYIVLGQHSTSAEISADDIYFTDADFNTMPYEAEKRLHTWQPDHVSLPTGNDWERCYNKINVFNTVLHNIEYYKIPKADNVKGQALVLRAINYLEAAQIWCLAYNDVEADSKLGLPLRLSPDMNIQSVRSTLKQTYNQILNDLHTALPLLPVNQISITRPSRVTALAYLTRTYLLMGDYSNALMFGKESLTLKNQLLDFNSLNPTSSYPIPAMNQEIIIPLSFAYSPFLSASKAKIPQAIYDLYDTSDLRKTIFFRKNPAGEILFKGNYTGSSARSAAMANDEIYLSVAESYAHLNDVPKAMILLNNLLEKRYKTGHFIPKAASSKTEALSIIRQERRKELIYRGLRWSDIKRYNKEGGNTTISRLTNGSQLSLPPNDLRYAIAIPEDIIQMTGMPQNER